MEFVVHPQANPIEQIGLKTYIYLIMRRILKKSLLVMSIALLIFLLLTILVPFIVFSSTSNNLQQGANRIKIIGHRGAAGLAPENTLASFKKAIEEGVDMIECDVHLSKDDSLIVMHDYKVNRTTNGEGEIQTLTYNDIRKLDAGSHFDSAFASEKVPTLDEVLALAGGKTQVLIELKWPSKGIYEGLAKKVTESIKRHNAQSWTIVQSFEKKYLQEFHEQAPELTCHQLIFGESQILPIYFDRTIHFGKFSPAPGVKSVNPFYLYLGKSFVNKMHEDNITIYPFTIDDEKKMVKAINRGADGIITNFPDKARKLLRGN